MEKQQKEDKKKVKNEYDYNTIMMSHLFRGWTSFEDETKDAEVVENELSRV